MSGHTAAGEQWSVRCTEGNRNAHILSVFTLKGISTYLFIFVVLLFVHGQGVFAQEEAAEDETQGLDTKLSEISFPDQKLTEVADLLSTLGGININVAGSVDPKISVNMNVKTEKSIREVLNDLAALYNLYIEFQADGGVTIKPGSEKPVKADNILEKTFPVKFNRPSEIIDLVRNFLSDRPTADALALDSQKTIVVRDIPEALARIEEFLNRLDIPKQSTVFPILYGDPQAIADLIRERLPDLEEGALTIDTANSQLIVKTTLENLAEIQLLIETLDIKKEIRVFTISFHDVEDVMDILEELGLLSEEGSVVSNENTGKLIIQDTPDRLDRIAEAIKAYDTPRPAVFVEAEILDVNAAYSFGWNPTLTFGDAVPNETTFGATTLIDGQDILRLAGSGAFEFAALDAGNVLARLQATESESDVQTIASPRLIVERLEEARLNVGSEEPIGVRSFSDSIYTGSSRDIVTQRVREVGIRLIVEALNISEKGYVELYVGLENSSVPPDGRIDIGGGTTGLRVLTANVETTAILKDGRTLALGGLLTRDVSVNSSGTPFLNKVPLIRYFFSNLGKADTRRKLLLFITPHILNIDVPLDKFMQDEEAFKKLEGKREVSIGKDKDKGFAEDQFAGSTELGIPGEDQWINRNGRWGYLDEQGKFIDRTAEFMSAYEGEGEGEAELTPAGTLMEGEPSASDLLRTLQEPTVKNGKSTKNGKRQPPTTTESPSEESATPPGEAAEESQATESGPSPDSLRKESDKGETPTGETKPRPKTGEIVSGEAAVSAMKSSAETIGKFKGSFRDLIRRVGDETGVRFGITKSIDRNLFNTEIEVDGTGKTYDQMMNEALDKQGMSLHYRKSEVPQIQMRGGAAPEPSPEAVTPPTEAPPAPTAPPTEIVPTPVTPPTEVPPATAPTTAPQGPQSRVPSHEDDPWIEAPLSKKGWSTQNKPQSNRNVFHEEVAKVRHDSPAEKTNKTTSTEYWELPVEIDTQPVPSTSRKLQPPTGFKRTNQPPKLSNEAWDQLLEGHPPTGLSQLQPPQNTPLSSSRHTNGNASAPQEQQPSREMGEQVALRSPQAPPPVEPKKGAWSKLKKILTPGWKE
jgi:type II secretory pathway component GspD/PulD (secretin)